MIQNELFRQCLTAIPAEQKAEFDLSFGIAERISEVLKSKNLTQKDFAHLLHKRDSEVSKWLTGRHNFTMQTIDCTGLQTDFHRTMKPNTLEAERYLNR